MIFKMGDTFELMIVRMVPLVSSPTLYISGALLYLILNRCLIRLLKVLVPRLFCPETGFLLMVAVMLVLRTYADVWMIQNGTSVEGYAS